MKWHENPVVVLILAEYARKNGVKMNYGGGHVVFEAHRDGVSIEVEAIDRGDGRKVWVDKELAGVIFD